MLCSGPGDGVSNVSRRIKKEKRTQLRTQGLGTHRQKHQNKREAENEVGHSNDSFRMNENLFFYVVLKMYI